MTANELRKELRLYMDRNGLNQKAAAKRAKISQQYLSDILRGRRQPSEAVCKMIGFRRSVEYWRLT